ncbi:anti-sigma factor antagonist [Bacillus aquiflavi]|uniref:Anti-sigma factor antagonist n=1 Tax=Bacillus aquiflavi TaxID=2672567 RepID=A0A6B3W022_9BACI|nr:anti-sigma factor antagonist [Bacillus aquiflavi]MBA4536829.1 anti-sigma factor antagonist [Bacillus aquiflavi]NEY81196.1 anti-sigma factor antagonist [Bacillus aquiflavi]UAC48492.1 anti-sigma factor antagonist [Bacillus aquiflavi]
MDLTININRNNEKNVTAFLNGEIDAYTSTKLRDALFPLAKNKGVNITIDLSGVSYMDSTGLGIFVGLFKYMRTHNGEFQLIGLSERLVRLFEITGLANIMKINSKIEGEIQ